MSKKSPHVKLACVASRVTECRSAFSHGELVRIFVYLPSALYLQRSSFHGCFCGLSYPWGEATLTRRVTQTT